MKNRLLILVKFYLLFLVIVSCSKTDNNLVRITGKRIQIDSTISFNQDIESIIKPYRQKLTNDMKAPLSEAPFSFASNDGNLQSTLGNLVADLCYEMASPVFKEKTGGSIDFVMMNSGGLRASISKGPVTRENAFLLMPFDNELVVTQLSSEKIKELFNYFLDRKKAHPLCRNVNLIINENDYEVKIKGEVLQEGKSYNVLTNDYLQSGGDGMTFFANPEKLINLDYKMRDAIIDYFTKEDVLSSRIDNRVIVNQK